MKKAVRSAVSALALLLMVTIAAALHAQSTTGSVYGVVTDSTGAAIPSATVTLKDVHTGLTQSTHVNGSGEYTFPAVNPGDYTVNSTAEGFQSQTQTGVALSANQNVHVTFALPAGATSQTVEVQADATLVDTRESQLAETIDQTRLENLPSLDRSTYSLVATAPGVSGYSSDVSIGSRNGANFTVNGLPADTVSYYLDGSYNTVFKAGGGSKPPNPDALQEFRLITSNFDAEFGRSPGAVANLITRSGTQHFHGTVYDYLRNDAFNAKGYFSAVNILKQNQFGAALGGPVPVLPQTFFFLSYEGLIEHQPAQVNAGVITTFTAAQATGDFSSSSTAIKSAIKNGGYFLNAAKTKCPVQYVMCTPIDPVAANIVQLLPPADPLTGTAAQTASANSSAHQGMARVDYNGLKNHSIEAMFFNSRGTAYDPLAGGNQVVGYAGMIEYENQANAVLVDTYTISDRTVNTARAFYAQNLYIINNLNGDTTLASLGSHAGEGGPIFAPPKFTVTGFFTAGGSGAGPSNITQSSFGLIDTAILTRGHHSIKLGGSWVRNKYMEDGGNAAGGNITFSGQTTGVALADFLQGHAQAWTQSNSVYHRTHQDDPSLFVQDDWQLTPRLNVNLGVRWEVFEPHTFDPQEGTFIKGQQSTVIPKAPVGFVYQGDAGVPVGLYNTSMLSFAPRVGFAYDAFGNGKTSVRGGYGLFYYQIDQINYGQNQQQPYGLSSTINQTPDLVNPYAPAVDPFPFVVNINNPTYVSGLAGAASIGNAQGSILPYVHEYNLTVEQQLNPAFAFSVGYVGNAMRKNLITLDQNAPAYVAGAATSTAALIARRPYEPYGTSSSAYYVYGAINLKEPVDNRSYNSLQATLRGRIGSKLNLLASYVWSKNLSFDTPTVDQTDIRKNYGLSDIDLRHRFAISYVYRLPEPRFWGLIGKEVLGGWQLSGLTVLQSGNPFTVTSGSDTNLDGTNNDRVDIVSNPYLPKGRSHADQIKQYLNVSAFQVPTSPYGNEQRNQLVGPGNINTNLGLQKAFPLYREAQFKFRIEAFNVFNNVNLNNPRTVRTALLNNPTQITGAGPARILQLSARIQF